MEADEKSGWLRVVYVIGSENYSGTNPWVAGSSPAGATKSKNKIIMQLVIELMFLAIAIYMIVSAFFFEPEDKQEDDKRTEN